MHRHRLVPRTCIVNKVEPIATRMLSSKANQRLTASRLNQKARAEDVNKELSQTRESRLGGSSDSSERSTALLAHLNDCHKY